MAGDAERMKRSGKPFTSRELAEDYGFRDVDGELPDTGPAPRR